MEIQLEETQSGGRYFVVIDGHEAEMTFSKLGENSIIIDHTGVPEALRGQHVGEALVQRGVKDARENGKSIVPLCPFAAAQFRNHPDWQDVIKV